AQHIPEFRYDNVTNLGIADNLFQVAGKVCHYDDSTGSRVLELVLHLPGCVQRVGVDDDKACAQGTEKSNGKLQAVRHLNGDALALLQAKIFLQVGSKVPRQPVDLSKSELGSHVLIGDLVRIF